MKTRAFTLIELLVVVLIIGILAAIAVPQYQKSVMKSQLHTGMPMVESLYQAQQSYYLTHGDFAIDVDDLDLAIPSGCTKRETTEDSIDSKYDCPWGVIGIGSGANIHYINPKGVLLYAHYYKNDRVNKTDMEAGQRYCFAKGEDKVAPTICESIGGKILNSYISTGWNRYKLP